jgi:hypothetical protein
MILPRHPTLLVLCYAAALAACAPVPDASPRASTERCPASSGGPLLVFELFFGRSIPPFGEVTASDWDAFVDHVVIPALPNGFTVYDAMGGWMSPLSGKTVHERTKVLMTALPDVPGSIASVNRIRNDYQVAFHQQMVGMTITTACGSF